MGQATLVGQAVILCGGMGTRLGALTATKPKPLLPVAGRPFLERLLFEIRRFGIRRILFLAAFQAEAIEVFAADACTRLGMTWEVAVEPNRAGTGGALWHARNRLDETFLLFNGDSWFDVNLLDVALTLRDPDVTVGMALRHIDNAARFGTVEVGGDRVVRFTEKQGLARAGIVNGGVYAMRRTIVEALRPDCSLEMDVLTRLAEERQIAGKIYEGFFLDIGVLVDYERAHVLVPAAQRRGAVFLYRNGVLNRDLGYTRKAVCFEWLPKAQASIKRLNDAGVFVFVMTNRAGVADRSYAEADVLRLHDHIQAQLATIGAHVDDFRFFPFYNEGSVEGYHSASLGRNAESNVLLDIIEHWPVDSSRSLIISNSDLDAQCGGAPGTNYCLRKGESLDEALDHLLPFSNV